jgi:hypothetical protein
MLAFGLASAQDDRDDVTLGLQGLMEAARDPALLAQLLQDMQVRTTFGGPTKDKGKCSLV